ncbi:MAG TPA: DMT family transporter, partial [Hyphomicrobiaceae bacterium]|nr:DMT family transporter [Hyphomicrobiaceae bacterium]
MATQNEDGGDGHARQPRPEPVEGRMEIASRGSTSSRQGWRASHASSPAPCAAKSATLLGTGAILLWATLASLTTLKGAIPPFQTTAIVFAIGGSVVLLAAALRGRLGLVKPTAASLGLGIAGLFGYHALYFAALALAPPAEAHLIASLWALFTVLFSGLLPGQRLRPVHIGAALLGLGAATILVWDKLGTESGGSASGAGFALAFACALVWSSYSVASRLFAQVPSESIAVACLATSLLALASSLAFETWQAPDAISWLALLGLGLGPVGAAFLLWDIGMKTGNVPLLGVLSYASPIL